MAEPTLRDLLEAIARLDTSTKSELSALRAELAAHRAETAKGFAEVGTALAELDRELSKHADVHRELEKDVEAIKRRPARTAARPARRG